MGNTAESIRKKVRKLIDKLGSVGTLYSFSSATVVKNDYGDDTSISWSAGSTIKFISSNNKLFWRNMSFQGLENDKGGRSLIIKDNISPVPSAKDKLVIGTSVYEVISIRAINPIQDTIIAYRIDLGTNERYKV